MSRTDTNEGASSLGQQSIPTRQILLEFEWNGNSDQNISLEVFCKLGQNTINVAENDEATIYWSRDVIDDRNTSPDYFFVYNFRLTWKGFSRIVMLTREWCLYQVNPWYEPRASDCL
jgi:hypothetical protein